MSEDRIDELWARARAKESVMSHAEIESLLRPGVRRSWIQVEMFVWIYLIVLAVTIAIGAVNVYGYRSNPVMLAVQVGVTVAALVFTVYGIHLLRQIRVTARSTASLLEQVHQRLRLYRGKYEIWLWMIALTALLLIHGVNTWVDNVGGVYRINQPFVFWGTQVAILLFIYGVTRAGLSPAVHQMKAALHDLEAQAMEQTPRIEDMRRRARRWYVLFAILCTISLLLGILAFVSRSG